MFQIFYIIFFQIFNIIILWAVATDTAAYETLFVEFNSQIYYI